ncbi:hypothetical protein FWG76_00170 [Candidatus Saccharibacteria bacterium]|nr:hypothetical protein [Candidatus Saccharibacteria bacterium]
MNDINAIPIGGLANKSQFFGSNTAETLGSTTAANGGWNEDRAESPQSSNPWAMFGGQSPSATAGNGAGMFAFARFPGNIQVTVSHRTILLGY